MIEKFLKLVTIFTCLILASYLLRDQPYTIYAIGLVVLGYDIFGDLV